MSDLRLVSAQQAILDLGELFHSENCSAEVYVQEDKCFGGKWLKVADVRLHPSMDVEGPDGEKSAIKEGIEFGFYDWDSVGFKTLTANALALLVATGEKEGPKSKRTTERAMEAVGHCLTRCGLTHPALDASNLSSLPLKRPCTLVADANAVMQGALDFAIRYLHPMARIKIPALVQMEMINMADRFFKLRRDGKAGAKTLLEHVTSQGGQRVLLRAELLTDAEIERPRLGADPLRGVVMADSDQEDKNLNLQVVQRSFADRLILETALQHRERMSADHPVMLLTADQGLARMSMSEGLDVFFIRTPPPEQLLKYRLSGTIFSPIVQAGGSSLASVPLNNVLWELAVSFGATKVTIEGRGSYTITAMGEGLPWSAYHAREDLLWVSSEMIATTRDSACVVSPSTPTLGEIPTVQHGAVQPLPPSTSRSDGSSEAQALSQRPVESTDCKKPLRSYRLSAEKLIHLIGILHLGETEFLELVRQSVIKEDSLKSEYLAFLSDAGLVDISPDKIIPDCSLKDLWSAISRVDREAMTQAFSNNPSFAAFLRELDVQKIVSKENLRSVTPRGFSAFVDLADLCTRGLSIPSIGLVATPNVPDVNGFVAIAMTAFDSVHEAEAKEKAAPGDDRFVLTGRWLEDIALNFRTHPVVTRDILDVARKRNLLTCFTEGSTPDTRFVGHNTKVLTVEDANPSIQSESLYEGLFVIKERASVLIRFELP